METFIAAPVAAVFEASLDVDAHVASMADSGEEAVGGVTSGTMGLGETVTWRAKHFGITWRMTSKITEMDRPRRFVDEQLRGPFHKFWHEHLFEAEDGGTRMVDRIEFDAPFGILGDLTERVILGSYLEKLIAERNEFLRENLER
ncbi:MAG: SRPBCC family protein [Acidimicrobiales bacterium]|nr:SRPBCC family protein [Acidimicrobiales bacterium]